MKNDIFFEVFYDLRLPYFAVDLKRLREGLLGCKEDECRSAFGLRIDAPDDKRSAMISSFRGIIRQIDVPLQMVAVFANSPVLSKNHLGADLLKQSITPGFFKIVEVEDLLIWEEGSLWPLAYTTLLTQLQNILTLQKVALEAQVENTQKDMKEAGLSSEGMNTVSEFPRQLPTHLHYAFGSLGAWIGGAINVQYFAYYAAIRQIFHSSLNVQYAIRIGFHEEFAHKLDRGGIISLPASLLGPLLDAQGTAFVFGSIGIDEVNVINPPAKSFFETRAFGMKDRAENERPHLPGFVSDKFYRATFTARKEGEYGFYGTTDVFRDHYENFYRDIFSVGRVRCKHYCVPIVEASSKEEIAAIVHGIPERSDEGVFFRGQSQLYTIDRPLSVKRMLFGNSCSVEPSLVTSAARNLGYDYDFVHFALRYFLEEKVLVRDELMNGDLYQRWRELSVSPVCQLDYAILALAQHYGLPSHGLDVTGDLDVAVWFATNRFARSEGGIAGYSKLVPKDWTDNPEKWPVVLACQMVTHSIGQSLHDCHELAAFGFEAMRPNAQSASFFLGGHSDHQNRLAEALVCVIRLKPGFYHTEVDFDSLFPAPEDDPAYKAMLEFANAYPDLAGDHVNRFH